MPCSLNCGGNRSVEVSQRIDPPGDASEKAAWAKALAESLNLMSELSEKECIPCKGGIPPLRGEALADLHRQLDSGWEVINEHHLEKEFKFKNFREALAFTNKVGELAEANNHHPDIYLAWGRVKVTIWTHKIDGLTESDFVMASKIDRLKQVSDNSESA